MPGRRYQLEQELGRGATGAGYRGRDVEGRRPVAFKVVSAKARAAPLSAPAARFGAL